MLIDLMGGVESQAGADKLKSISGWNMSKNGNNSSGFNGMPGGYRSVSCPTNVTSCFYGLGNFMNWWSSTEEGEIYSYCSFLGGENIDFYTTSKRDGMYIRSIKD
jgi:uncharacterized protein (TIGR02145 family)